MGESMRLYSAIARSLAWTKTANGEWKDKANERLEHYMAMLPHGSGFDSPITVDAEKSNERKLVFIVSFHAMDDNGYYDGWYEYIVTINANLCFSFDLVIRGKDHQGTLKDYIAECLHSALSDIVDFSYHGN